MASIWKHRSFYHKTLNFPIRKRQFRPGINAPRCSKSIWAQCATMLFAWGLTSSAIMYIVWALIPRWRRRQQKMYQSSPGCEKGRLRQKNIRLFVSMIMLMMHRTVSTKWFFVVIFPNDFSHSRDRIFCGSVGPQKVHYTMVIAVEVMILHKNSGLLQGW